MRGLVVVLTLTLVCVGSVSAAGSVIQLTDANFKSKVVDSEDPWFVKFYAPWCGHCKSMAADWEKTATNLKGMVNMAEVDCTVHQKTCSQYDVKGYPTLKIFPAGKDKKKSPEAYQGARDAKSFADAASRLIPSAVKAVTDSSLAGFLEANPTRGKVLLFTSKTTTTTLYKAFSARVKAFADVGEVRNTQSATAARYGVTEFPKLLLLTSGTAESPIVYTGEFQIEALVAWAKTNLGVSGGEEPPTTASSSSEKATAGGEDTASKYSNGPAGKTAYKAPSGGGSQGRSAKVSPVVELTGAASGAGSFEDACKKESTKVCVFAVVEFEGEEQCTSENPTVAEKQAARNALVPADQLATLNSLAEKYAKDGFAFSWVDGKKQPAFKTAFGVSSTPTLVMYKDGARKRFTVHAGGFTEKELSLSLDRVIGGDAPFTALKEFPALTPPEGCGH